jgi:adenine-specific DNA-methyltransferase
MLERRPQDNPRRKILKRDFARVQRARPTDAEYKLWWLLRSKRLAGLRFRRQQPIGPYIADFYCAAAKLIVELDGSQHGLDANVGYDERRTRWLEARGYRVLRFFNDGVLRDPKSVVEGVWHAIKEMNCPLPEISLREISALPQGEGK